MSRASIPSVQYGAVFRERERGRGNFPTGTDLPGAVILWGQLFLEGVVVAIFQVVVGDSSLGDRFPDTSGRACFFIFSPLIGMFYHTIKCEV